jgi:fatty-acyl-CoA synthase
MERMNYAGICRFWARWQPDQVAIRFGEDEITWRDLDERTDRLAAGFADLGVGRGDRIGLLMLNRPEFLETCVATMKLGAMAVPMNVRFTPTEIAFLVADAGCAIVVTDATLAPAMAAALADRPELPVVLAEDFDSVRRPTEGPFPVTGGDDDPLYLCYTSGTTGNPKAAVLTHRSWDYASRARALQSQMSAADRVLLPFPLAFTGGLSVAMTTMWCGATLVLEPAFDASRALDLIEQQRISVFMAVPLIYQQMADLPRFGAADLSSLRIASTGGAAVPPALLQTYLDRDVIVVQTYALTEATAGGTTLPSHDGLRKLGSAGVPAMHSELRVVRHDGASCAVGEVGEIAIRGPEVMVGYWKNPEATAATLVEGWLRTGDLGYLDEEGYLFVVDRAKDMLISGGLNVYPAEIEKVLAALPGVTELAVIGVPDREWGETPAVIAVGDDAVTPASVLDACRGVLADFKMPRYLVVRTEPLPRNMSGKVLKRELRTAYRDLPSKATPIR